MEDIYNEFINLSLQQATEADYANKSDVKKHNEASRKMRLLFKKIKQSGCIPNVELLLNHPDDRVKVNAVALCYELEKFIVEAEQTVRNIIFYSTDKTIIFSAKMLAMNNNIKQRKANDSPPLR